MDAQREDSMLAAGAAAKQSWPKRLAGRELQASGNSYALYANDAKLGTDLHRWLERQLARYCSQYALPEGRGVVIAIEPGVEPFPAVEEWEKHNVSRARVVDWVSEHKRGHTFHGRSGRPYSFFRDPYFRESFVLAYDDAVRIRVLDTSTPEPAWICLLTTDAHATENFNEKIRRYEEETIEKEFEVNKGLTLDERFCRRLFYVMFKLCVPVYRFIDVDMMHLQRRETLWQTLIHGSEMNEDDRLGALSRLQDETDEAWTQLYFSRPTD